MGPLDEFIHWLVFRYTDPGWVRPGNETGWTWESDDWTTRNIEHLILGWCIVLAIYTAPKLWRDGRRKGEP